MLSIQPLKSASGSAGYYLNVVNYYNNDSKSIRWLGEGAKALSLHNKPVEKEQMLALLKGLLPDGTQLGRINKEGIHHRPGFDMTVSAPKSFSILLESGADPRLGEALDKTVEWFVTEMEQEFAQARLMVDGQTNYVNTKNFVISAFRQPNSRANDPQSHVHLVAMNMTQCKDGKWRSLASDMNAERGVVEQIMKNHIYGGLKFRNKLANLTKELGYTLETTGDGLWEIKGFPKEVLAHFSKRREDIESYMQENGLHGARAASIATQRTKTDKEIVDFRAWKEDILTTCKSFGFDAIQFVAKTKEPSKFFARIKEGILSQFFDKEKFQTIKGNEAVSFAIESVSQQHAVFSPQKIKEHALKHLIASDWVVDERYIDKAIEDNIIKQKLYSAQHPVNQKPMLTTPWQLKLESETIARMEQGKKSINPICTKSQVNAFIQTKETELEFSLSPSQKKAMLGFLTSSDRFMAIQGYAGTGKTTMLKLTKELAELKGYQLRGITAGSAAASELHSKGGISAATFARELIRLQKNKEDLTRTIFVIDEASMLSNPQGHKIMQLIDNAGSQLKIIGDRAQLPSPSSGRWFSLIQEYGIDTIQMTDNLRQAEGLLKESAIHASRGEIYDAVEKLTEIKEHDTYQARIEEAANTWLKLSPEERQHTLCFAPTHKNRKDITQLIRSHLKEEGKLSGEIYYQNTLTARPITSIELRKNVYYTEGEVLRFNLNLPRYNIKAGDYLTVQEITSKHKKTNSLRLLRDNGRAINFPLSALPKFKESDKDLERPVEIYRQGIIELQAGDIIQWKRNDASKKIHNSDSATIKAISKEKISIRNQNNQELVLKCSDAALKHLDHGYVLTTYGAQGKDSKRGIGLIESLNRFAATIENFYVEVTRAVEEMIVVTDDKTHLVKAITTRDSEKASSMEYVNNAILQQHSMQNREKGLSLENVIEKKRFRENQWNQMEQDITAYNEAKQSGNKQISSILAFRIVNDPACYRLARARLSQGYKTYQRDAIAFQTAKFSSTLKGDERHQFNTVKQYVLLSERVIKESQRMHALADIKNDKTMTQKLLQQRYNALNKLAFVISQDLKSHQPWLAHFSIGEANRLGLPQHHIQEENQKAYTKLEKLAERAAIHNNPSFKESVEEYTEKKPRNSPSLPALNQASPALEATAINERLIINPIDTYKAIFGEPKSITSKEMRYSGGLIVTLKGNKQGFWYDFTEGHGGLPIDAIMSSGNLDFKAALKIAADMAGIYSNTEPPGFILPKKNDPLKLDNQQLIENKKASAKSIWEGSVPIQGTLAETYLKKHRGIQHTKQLNVQFWPKGAKWINCDEDGNLVEKTNQIPALIIPAHNKKNQLTGVQRIYLDAKTGGKNQFMDTPKLSKGILEGSAAMLQSGMKGSTVYICEGAETAASIAQAFPTATVIASLGIGNIKNLAPFIHKLQRKEIIIAADYDGVQSKTSLTTNEAAESLKKDKMSVRIVYPEPIEHLKKTDWNDVLIHKGTASIQTQFSGIAVKNTAELYEINGLINKGKSVQHAGIDKSKMQIDQKTSVGKVDGELVQKVREMEI